MLTAVMAPAADAWAEPQAAQEALPDGYAGPTSIFPSLEAAALDALAHAHHTAQSRDRGRLRSGTIYRVATGFRYSEPTRSEGTVWSSRSPVLRFSFRPADVASYVIHPRSGIHQLDRANERPNEAEQRLVEELDPMSRPLYLLTPSLRVVRYSTENRVSERGGASPGLAARAEGPGSQLFALGVASAD